MMKHLNYADHSDCGKSIKPGNKVIIIRLKFYHLSSWLSICTFLVHRYFYIKERGSSAICIILFFLLFAR